MEFLSRVDQFQPNYSLLSAHVRSPSFSRYIILVAAPALAALDIAYHSVALVLKSIRAVVLCTLGSFVGPCALKRLQACHQAHIDACAHLSAIASAALAGLSFTFVGLCGQEKVMQLHNRIYPQPKVEIAIPHHALYAKIAVVSLATLVILGFAISHFSRLQHKILDDSPSQNKNNRVSQEKDSTTFALPEDLIMNLGLLMITATFAYSVFNDPQLPREETFQESLGQRKPMACLAEVTKAIGFVALLTGPIIGVAKALFERIDLSPDLLLKERESLTSTFLQTVNPIKEHAVLTPLAPLLLSLFLEVNNRKPEKKLIKTVRERTWDYIKNSEVCMVTLLFALLVEYIGLPTSRSDISSPMMTKTITNWVLIKFIANIKVGALGSFMSGVFALLCGATDRMFIYQKARYCHTMSGVVEGTASGVLALCLGSWITSQLNK